ncbi:MAG: TerC family protein [Pirellulales bacterium]
MDSILVWAGPALHVFLVNLVLSGDNAVVIAMAANRLPPQQRRQAVVWGLLIAIGLRIALTCFATWLVRVPGLMIAGGVALYYIACQLLADRSDDSPESDQPYRPAPDNLRAAIRTIAVADVAMSLDNVLAVSGASHGDQSHMLLGLISSVVLMVLFSNTIATIMDRCQWLFYVGAAILAFTATQMIAESHEVATLWATVGHWLPGNTTHDLAQLNPLALKDGLHWTAQIVSVAGCLFYGHSRRRQTA